MNNIKYIFTVDGILLDTAVDFAEFVSTLIIVGRQHKRFQVIMLTEKDAEMHHFRQCNGKIEEIGWNSISW